MGDPKQLRHVSFLSDAQRDLALRDAGVDPASAPAARLDVRRNSAFDVAAAVAPVLTLDENFRGRPHLVEFVARRLYDSQVHVATRSPATEAVDCIDQHLSLARRGWTLREGYASRWVDRCGELLVELMQPLTAD